MNIGSIGSPMNTYMGQMVNMGNRSNPPDPFEKADEDDSGGLDETEFSELATHLSEMTGDEVDKDELFATYDEDGDGILSEEETKAFMEDNRPKGPPPGGMGPPPEGGGGLSEIFTDTDEDEDGYLDEAETETIAEMISNATSEETTTEALIDAYDEDGDGVLSEEEALAALEENQPEEQFSNMNGIGNYLKVASLVTKSDETNTMPGIPGQTTTPYSSGTFYSFNA